MNIRKTTTGTDFPKRQLEGQGRKFSMRNQGGSKRPSSGGSSGSTSGEGPAGGPTQDELGAAAGLLALGN